MASAKRTVARQCDGILLPDTELVFDDDEFAGCTVADVLADPARFEGATLADPLEGVEDGPCKAKVFIQRDGTLWINSFAHGGVTYQLKYDAAAVRRAIERGDADFIEVASAADLTKKEEKELCNFAADRSGTSRQAVAAKLKDARDNGWLRPAEPTYATEGTYSSADEARNRTRQLIQDFLEKNVGCPKAKRDPFREFAISIFSKLPIAKAMRVATGIGKTKIAIQDRWPRPLAHRSRRPLLHRFAAGLPVYDRGRRILLITSIAIPAMRLRWRGNNWFIPARAGNARLQSLKLALRDRFIPACGERGRYRDYCQPAFLIDLSCFE